MRRIKAIDGDIFTPTGQTKLELDLAREHPDEVIEVIGRRLSHERKMRIEDVISHRTNKLQVAVEGVNDPHNTAAIIRTADAYGIQNVHIIEGAKKFKSSKKVTQGSHKWVDISVWSTTGVFIEAMRQKKMKVLVAAMVGEINVNTMPVDEPTVLVFGNEAEGISKQMFELCDGAFRIPMFGFVESLNVSVAAAVAVSSLRKEGICQVPPPELQILKARFYLRAIKAGYDIVMLNRQRSQKK